MLDGDVEEALIQRAVSDIEYHPDHLTETIIVELLKRKEISEEDAEEWRSNL